ncbi:hypothetical protein PUNSTDRAFT_102837 [Punctularia strigosozonata HHB-11173 SS5]|uniref:uncharacterized protein n=1 Tax=Punctularia strigosozonata (strain HHB-11173) TaxID=741275 RepID=UPI0004418718|nr:uncharacterized protein PUNSTDRAFT_102837 [Punctularia strigosozonata HHB-11173 SS5]EIN09328.1 hypothetical protein PUNSTDRAFT_102837 [Punctularia strigosozonata HHB-11173 SS5]
MDNQVLLPLPATYPRYTDPEVQERKSRFADLKEYLMSEVNPELCSYPLAGFTFMTGYIDAVTFSAVGLWCGYQTGNSAQLAIAIARLFQVQPDGSYDLTFHMHDRLALASLITFCLGAIVGRMGDKLGPKTRLWLMLGTFIQGLMTMAAAIAIWKSGQPSFEGVNGAPAWTNPAAFVSVGFMSASFGLQGIMAKRLNTSFTTTLVLTTAWCELVADPKHRRTVFVKKISAIVSLLIGVFVGRSILQVTDASVTLGIGCGVRVFFALVWFFAPAKRLPSKFTPRKRPDPPPALKPLTLNASAAIQTEKIPPVVEQTRTSYIPFPSEKPAVFFEPPYTPPQSPRDRRPSRPRKRTLSRVIVNWWNNWSGRGTRSRQSSFRSLRRD